MMPYFSFGNLQYQHEEMGHITRVEIKRILFQALTALAYLHLRGVAHRDLKPENILVESRTPFKIQLADFGLANDKLDLNTLCGTQTYAAPEVFSLGTYTPLVDLWSLGIIVLEYTDGLPRPVSERYGMHDWLARINTQATWCHRIVQFTNFRASNKSDVLTDLLAAWMLRIEPEKRLSAGEFLRKAHDVGLFDGCTSDTQDPTPPQQTVLQDEIDDDQASTTIMSGALSGAEAISGNDSGGVEHRDLEHISACPKPSSPDIQPQSYKRQRSPIIYSARNFSDRDRNKRRLSNIHGSVLYNYTVGPNTGHDGESIRFGTIHEVVLALLTDLQGEDCPKRGIDDHTCALVEELCAYFTRLKITGMRLSHNGHSDCATVTARVNSKEFVLARLTASEQMSSTTELARQLLHMLQFHNATSEAGSATPTARPVTSLRTCFPPNLEHPSDPADPRPKSTVEKSPQSTGRSHSAKSSPGKEQKRHPVGQTNVDKPSN